MIDNDDKKIFYSHKFNMYLEDFETLCFSAYFEMSDPKNFDVIDVPIFAKDPLSISLFHDIIEGNIKHTFVDNDMNKYAIEINEGSAEKNIKKYIELQDEYFPTKIKILENSVDSIGFRFDGSSYNLRYSIPYNMATKFEDISRKAIKIIDRRSSCNNEFYQAIPKAASTMLRYTNESLDPNIERVIDKISTDVRIDKIDNVFIEKDDYGLLYKDLLKTFKEILSVKDLESFEVYINDKPYPVNNLKCLRNIKQQLNSKKVKGYGKKIGYKSIQNGKKHSTIIELIELDKIQTSGEYHLHVFSDQTNMIKNADSVAINDEDNLILFNGYFISEKTIECEELIVINPKKQKK
ncbi:hypothetical protein [Aliarcobacter butzleri]|uniref:hypothetical protein n=1 Tax=Aliarcobacter butzleri TaxID=28197 RepID=UPI00125F6DAC|nr:hypothetical protein [Aliarcobacter butzleri]MCG3665083.1 hypothetical protein [Aliarcobacter butzleri]MCT7638383.1 hypothetical protein [Aliarcobacter butzleri]